MAIEVAGKRFVTLADEFFVNGAKVYEAYANGVKVYPEDEPEPSDEFSPTTIKVYRNERADSGYVEAYSKEVMASEKHPAIFQFSKPVVQTVSYGTFYNTAYVISEFNRDYEEYRNVVIGGQWNWYGLRIVVGENVKMCMYESGSTGDFDSWEVLPDTPTAIEVRNGAATWEFELS